MPFQPGDTLGPYEILELIGKGGMGEVYRAHDSRLNRDVAIKVSNAQFNERFAGEARAIAALNHTNICHLYDIGPSYLVMEYVEGQDLCGPMDFDDALPTIQQLIDGIEAAHEKNIIHRDLKPANIKITPEGVVKILDFGLAKAMEPPPPSDGNPENSPTLTIGATAVGTILGTAAYMAPEQAKGKQADKRSDIWSFGVILYEVLTGKRLFQGETAVEILGGILNKDPDISATPARVHRLLRWCLEKDRKQRLQAIGDARRLLREPEAAGVAAPSVPPRQPRFGKLPWIAATVMTAVAAAALWAPWRSAKPADRPLIRLSVDLGPDAVRGRRISALLSPDGTLIVYSGRAANGLTQLYARRLDQSGSTLLANTNLLDASPFFSPDGEWIGFAGLDGKVKKIALRGGAVVTLGANPGNSLAVLGASWGEDDNIILGTVLGLWRMPGRGGTAKLLTKAAGVQVFPQVLPGAEAVLFNSSSQLPSSMEGLNIEALRLDTGTKKMLVRGGYWPRYLPTTGGTGHLVYMHEGTLFGVGFDPRRLELLGTATPVLEDVAASASMTEGGGQFAASNTGTFVYLSGHLQGASYSISWLDAAGKIAPLVTQPGVYGAPRLSPDGKRLAYVAAGSNGYDAWVYDLERATPTQLTFLGSVNVELAWARDSKHLVYGDGAALWWVRADGAGQPQLILDKASNPRPGSFASDGRLVFSPALGPLPDIWTLPVDLTDPEHPKPGKAEPFLADPALVEVDPAFSPDGKFIAYASNESGDEQVFVRPFPRPGGKWKVSTRGGKFPAWSAATHELLFLGSEDRIMAASYSMQGDLFNAGTPRVWSPTPILRNNVQQNFDVSPDGKRVVMFPRPVAEETGGNLHATFLLNFFDALRRRVPTGK